MDSRQQIGEQVKSTAIHLGDKLADLDVTTDIGMAALALVLATTAKTRGMTAHETISRFTTTVRSVFKGTQ